MLLNYRKIMVLYNARPIFGVFPSFQPASAQGKDGSAHRNMMTEKVYLIHNSTMLQFTFSLISKDENDKRKTADAPLSLFTQPTNPLIYGFIYLFILLLLVVMSIINIHSWVKWPCNRLLSAPASGENATPRPAWKFGNLLWGWQTRPPNRAS